MGCNKFAKNARSVNWYGSSDNAAISISYALMSRMTKNLRNARITSRQTMENEKQAIIDEIQKRIQHLIQTDQITDAEKVAIAREFLNIVENGEKEGVVQ